MNREQVNQLQHRVLKPDGYKYDSLIEKTNCKTFQKGHGPAGEILTVMVGYASKYAYQVKEVAQKLLKNDLQSTCNAFYQFQRDYIQYDVDGRDQRLRTPSCLWSERLKGGDCKSFAIMSAALCASVGIKTYLRQIKVDGTQHENRINHVYCIVPVDQNTGSLTSGHYVIDGSSKINIEAPYYWKNDMEVDLPYYGMNAAVLTGASSCGCKNKNAQTVEKTTTIPNIDYEGNERDLAILEQILGTLVAYGASEQTANSAVQYAISLLENGKLPNIEATGNIVYINGKPFTLEVATATGMNFDFSSLGSAVVSGGTTTVPVTSGNTNTSSFLSGLNGLDLGGLAQGDTAGSAIGGVAGGVAAASFGLPPGIGSSIGSMLGSLFGGGHAFTAEKIEREVAVIEANFEQRFTELSNSLQSGNVTQASLQWSKILGFADLLARTYRQKLSEGWSSQSEANIQTLIDTVDLIKNSLQSTVKQDLEKVVSIQLSGQTIPMGGDEDIIDFSASGFWSAYLGNDVDIQVPLYQLTAIPVTSVPVAVDNGTVQGIDNDVPTPSQNGFGTTDIVIGISLLTAAAIAAIKMKNKKAPTSKK